MDSPMTGCPSIQSRLRTKVLRALTLTITKLGTHKYTRTLFTHSSGTILCLNFCIKFGESVTLQEANTIRFVAKHTTIPVPKVHYAFIHHNTTYILMERIRGETIAKKWHSLSDASKSSIFSQLKQMIQELRSVPCQNDKVSNVDGGPVHDYRIQPSSWGPFGTITDFHLSLRNNVTLKSLELPNSLGPAAISDLKQLIAFHESVPRAPVLTHGDLSSLNILIRDDTVVGIIDWDTAGWLPYYWEYTMALHANPQNYFWQNQVGNFLSEQEVELSMDKLRRTYFGEC
jgi:aminoglycoside phosphotransferase